MRTLAGAVVAVLLAGCGSGGGSAGYGGMTRDEALLAAHDAAAYEANSPSSDLYRKQPKLARLDQDRNAAGGEAWVAVFDRPSSRPVCIWLWQDESPLGGRLNSEVGSCDQLEEGSA